MKEHVEILHDICRCNLCFVLVKMPSDAYESYKEAGIASRKLFQEKMTKLKRELKETEEKLNKYKDETTAARWKEHNAKLKMRAMSEEMGEIEEKIRRIEDRIAQKNSRRKEIAEKYRENLRVKQVWEGFTSDIEQKMRELHEAQQHTMEVQRMNKGLSKVITVLEHKIEKAENRASKASDRAFVLRQKLAVHRHLTERRPERLAQPDEKTLAPMSEQEAKIMEMQKSLEDAVLRRREAEKKRCALQRKIDIMEQALQNYKRRNLEFQVSKRELLSSNFY